MCPFLDDEDDFDEYSIDHEIQNKVPPENKANHGYAFLHDDRKFFVIGGAASVVAFCAVAYLMYSNSKSVDIDDLPVIKADSTAMKEKPKDGEGQVDHQDKVVYDNISGEKAEAVAVKTVPQPEEVLSINEADTDTSLSEEEKKNIIQAFDELAPEKEYKINYIKSSSKKQSGANKSLAQNASQKSKKYDAVTGNTSGKYDTAAKNVSGGGRKQNSKASPGADGLVVVENNDPPIKRLEMEYDTPDVSRKKSSLRELVNKSQASDSSPPKMGGNIMVQIASLTSRSGAEVEYKRILQRNSILSGLKKTIVKVDLGRKKGIRYRVLVGPFKNSAESNKVINAMKTSGVNAFVSR